MYADDQGGRLPSHAFPINDPFSLPEIGAAIAYPRSALAAYIRSDEIWRCGSEQTISPWGRPSDVAGTSLVYAGFGNMVWQMPSQYDPSIVPVVWDIDAWHGGQRNVGYYDGHVKISGPATMVEVAPSPAWAGETGVQLTAGQVFSISAGGQWTTCDWSAPLSLTTPSGYSDHAPPDMIRGDMSEGGLLGMVGGQVFYVGYGGRFTAPATGELVLGMNDNPRLSGNNAGTVWAFIW